MKLSCDVIRDILPLYAENMVSDDTKALVDEHLPGCESCSNALARMRSAISIPPETDIKPLNSLKQSITKERILAAWQAILITLSVIGCLLVYFTGPQYLSAEDAVKSVEDPDGNGIYQVSFREAVSYYVVYDYDGLTQEQGSQILFCAGDRLQWWFGIDRDRNPKRITINPKTERILYGTENAPVWGSEAGEKLLPELNPVEISLAAALAAAVVFTGLWALLRRLGAGKWLAGAALLFWSYLAAHMALCGFDLRTYKLFEGPDLIAVTVICCGLALVLFGAAVLSIRRQQTLKEA